MELTDNAKNVLMLLRDSGRIATQFLRGDAITEVYNRALVDNVGGFYELTVAGYRIARSLPRKSESPPGEEMLWLHSGNAMRSASPKRLANWLNQNKGFASELWRISGFSNDLATTCSINMQRACARGEHVG